MVKRVSFKLFLLLLAPLFSINSSPSYAEETLVLKVAHNGPASHPFQDGFEKLNEVLENETDGKITVQIFPSEQLGTEEETSLMIKQGAIGCAAESAGGGLAPFVEEADLLNLPFLFRDLDHFYAVVDGAPGDFIARKIEDKLDAIVLGWWFSGVRNEWNNQRPIYSPQDLEGLKIRVMGSPVLIDTFNALGAQATPMSFGEVYTSLQQGVIDGGETDHVDLLVENFYEVTKFVSLTGHMYLAAALICSKKVYDKLDPVSQIALLKAGKATIQVQRNSMSKKTQEAHEALIGKGLEFNEVDINLFRNKVKSVYIENAHRLGGESVIEQIINQY